MSKPQIIYYVGAIAFITLSAYLYTSVVQAPKDSLEESKSYVPSQDMSTSSVDATNEVDLTDESPTSTVVEETPPTTNFSLTNTNWRWLRTESATGTKVSEPTSTKPFILKFGLGDSMGSLTDCNTIGGSFKTNGNSLTFGPLMSTKMFCENSQEDEYATQLSKVTNYSIVDNTLRLTLSENTGIMFFVQVK